MVLLMAGICAVTGAIHHSTFDVSYAMLVTRNSCPGPTA